MAKSGKNGWALGLALLLAGLWWLLHQGSLEPQRPPVLPPKVPTEVASVPTAVPTPETGPRLALVIDDWGYERKPVEALAQLGIVITVSVLPHHAYSAKAAETGHAAGDEILLHCPMQAQGKAKPEKDTLRVGMDAAEARKLLASHWAAVPYAIGLNNHEGSKATEDPALMAVVAGFLKEKDAFFLDSVTTNKSVVPAAAKAAGIPWAKRRIFLDNEVNGRPATPEEIRKQLADATQFALKHGSCIAIGHPHANTLAVLKEEGPALQAQGIRLVHVSELLAH